MSNNHLKHYNGISYYYDELGNLIHRELPNGEVQNYFYDLHDQLVKVEIFKKDGSKETWVYCYDALGRRIGKGRLKENANEVSDRHSTDHACLNTPNSKDILDSEITFLWDGSHLLQEQNSDGLYTYIYTDQDSYEPLAQIHNYTNAKGETYQDINYFHCDQIGIPREMTDREGNLLWFGDYYGWGKLKSETNVTGTAHQPFRLQNQYCDRETGLHYNFFRYYDPDVGRFVNQDPIGLWGGENFYQFAPNGQVWIDPFGLSKCETTCDKLLKKHNVKLGTHREMSRTGGRYDSHHIFQDAAVKDITGYKRNDAIAIVVRGRQAGSRKTKDTPHYRANQAQNHAQRSGTLGDEALVALEALIDLGLDSKVAMCAVIKAKQYFNSLGASLSTPTKKPKARP